MPEFILETSGRVECPSPIGACICHAATWEQLDAFTQGYIEALFFTDEEQLCEESEDGHEMPEVAFNLSTMESRFVGGNSYGFSDLGPDTLQSIIDDCAAFQTSNAALLNEAYQRDYDAAQAGCDFWFTRNGHGVGYWDRDALNCDHDDVPALQEKMRAEGTTPAEWSALLDQVKKLQGDLGERLSTAARKCGERWSYVGDDGKVHLS